ncbi:MAG: tRNA (adenosine(37)-N6)-threonylcarbamoyltransferase complex dimerization subunit type 1 TsaB [Candidatus Omnitrophota bacterium]
MKILAIETSTRNLGLAIADDEKILAEYRGDSLLRHAQDLIPGIESLLKKLKLRLTDIDSFAVSIGPGSFTGLRIGVSTLKGLNLATNIPIVVVPTLDAIAYSSKDSTVPVCVIVDAKKKNLYASLYKTVDGGIIREWDYAIVSAEELIERIKGSGVRGQGSGFRGQGSEKEILFVGDGVGLYEKQISEKIEGARFAPKDLWYPDVKVVGRMGAEKFKRGEFAEPDTLVPMYIYPQKCNVQGINR